MSNVITYSRFTEYDIELFRAGKHFRLYKNLGSHLLEVDGQKGTYFAVWAPNAQEVSVVGSFNYWNKNEHKLNPRWDSSGIWEGFIPHVGKGALYKYHIHAKDGRHLMKGDPFARLWETPPKTASIVWDSHYEWMDADWMSKRADKQSLSSPMSVYEVHLASWKKSQGSGFSLSYRELAEELVQYVKEMGYTHVEFMPVMEHPYYPSWGYQITGYFAPSSRYGSPEDFMYLVDCFHQEGIGVILDWVPSHFPEDAHGLAQFDGTHLYEHADPRKGFHPDWKSLIFNYGRLEVRSFLISNALFWLDEYHTDGLRVDAVASMLYLDYSRNEGEWIPNEFGGRENMEAISFLKEFNEAVYREYPDTVTIAEESTSWTGVSRPLYDGGLGFGQKWMMGWMHDTLSYFKENPVHRRYHHNDITFSMVYAFTENFMLPLSHDEVVHGKQSLIGRMPGDEWQRFANLRLLYGYMYGHVGTNLLFMGGEFGQTSEWSHEKGLEWWLLEYRYHQGVQSLVKDLNRLYQDKAALYQKQFSEEGFEWIDLSDYSNSVISFVRKGTAEHPPLVVICNFTPVVRSNYKVGVPYPGHWKEIINTDDVKYGGSGIQNDGEIETFTLKWHGRDHALNLKLPPLGMIMLEPVDFKPLIETSQKEASPKELKEELLASIGKGSKKGKDDLQQIRGIGPKLEHMLNDIGLNSYKQLSRLKSSDYELIDSLLTAFRGRGQRDDWAGQAKKLMD